MLNIGAGEIAVILVVALLILGPKRLPEMARGIGKFLREFRRQTDEVRTTIETEFYRMDRDILREEFRKNPPAVPTAPEAPGLRDVNVTGPLDGGRRPANEIATPPSAAEAFGSNDEAAAASLPPALRAAAAEARAEAKPEPKKDAAEEPANKVGSAAPPAPAPVEVPQAADRWEE